MPSTTPYRHYPFPVDADPIDVAGDINKLATALDVDARWLVPQFTSIADRNAQIPNPAEGQTCRVQFSGGTLGFVFRSGAWRPFGPLFGASGSANQAVGTDATWFNLSVSGLVYLNVTGSAFDGTKYTIPYTGRVRLTGGANINIPGVTAAQQVNIILALASSAPWTGRVGQVYASGALSFAALGAHSLDVAAGQQVWLQTYIDGAQGLGKTSTAAQSLPSLYIEYI